MSTTLVPAALLPGTILRNGSRIVHSRLHDDGETYVILAEKLPYVQDEYVCWRANATGDCFWGHYFRGGVDAIQAAYKDFVDR